MCIVSTKCFWCKFEFSRNQSRCSCTGTQFIFKTCTYCSMRIPHPGKRYVHASQIPLPPSPTKCRYYYYNNPPPGSSSSS
ncbi:hypothetical protein OrNV_gp139 [Oryctes rhinoceros nudivirus]|uniref:Uncharacterized protein n=1 Tax=Oryctes rhinoceros nudivirus TaxID=92521 RepID=A3QU15_9VIRU|nr:hypothetical protein OrNV_gp139 [Oryctes rhinoceros nudivirus]ABF93351.1 unknown [Oryctes rhinoceros nudivirus]ACH96269.1 unknown [Oryctes rhinoceros nudivirus]QHG11369.1 hypothetical protein SI_OrNV_gp139 [Oryctes rhinoceros nudivirus]QKE59597.1 hypothetical protein SI_OrNV_gp139 [Oryctes rhinoceros nudivirus]UBO76544.1 hypothetical protein SI_OrNV_gp139 [Oryctes rhinoceros nudivirus]